MEQRLPVLAHQRFQESKGVFAGLGLEEGFARICATNLWGSSGSVCGLGSELDSTARIRELLPELLNDLGVRTMLDIPWTLNRGRP